MAIPTWPSTLPQRLLQQGYEQGIGDGRIISQTDTGPGIVRRRSSAMPDPLAGSVRLSPAQLQTAIAFVKDTLIGGSREFMYPHPLTRQPVLVRFSTLPAWSAVSGDLYDMTMMLEILP